MEVRLCTPQHKQHNCQNVGTDKSLAAHGMLRLGTAADCSLNALRHFGATHPAPSTVYVAWQAAQRTPHEYVSLCDLLRYWQPPSCSSMCLMCDLASFGGTVTLRLCQQSKRAFQHATLTQPAYRRW